MKLKLFCNWTQWLQMVYLFSAYDTVIVVVLVILRLTFGRDWFYVSDFAFLSFVVV